MGEVEEEDAAKEHLMRFIIIPGSTREKLLAHSLIISSHVRCASASYRMLEGEEEEEEESASNE